MSKKTLKVLLIVDQCNPEWTSVPLVGHNFYESISQLVDVTLVTHGRNRLALQKRHPDSDIVYISESPFIKRYYKVAERLGKLRGRVIIWPLYNTLIYPVYAEFNHLVYIRFKDFILNGDYDIIHSITPMMPRYPVKAIKACKDTPFILGPVNGGVPFPKGFQNVARQEFSYLNFLRLLGRIIIPGYRETYKKTNYILCGSSYTLDLVKRLFNIDSSKIGLFFENGISSSFLRDEEELTNAGPDDHTLVKLLFVGRLVPYKGADILLEGIRSLDPHVLKNITLTIVGDGSERGNLERMVQDFHLDDKVFFTGWIAHQETINYYRNSDIFCFPSIREFGGAVVLEAMANGLPCIVVKNGGIGEYVTQQTGFAIEPVSREFVVQELKKYIELLLENKALRQEMSVNSIRRAREFTWDEKARRIVEIYDEVLASFGSNRS